MDIVGIGCISALGKGKETFLTLNSLQSKAPRRVFEHKYLADTRFYQGDLAEETAQSAYQLALIACQEALADACIETQNIALVVATGAGDTSVFEHEVGSSESPYDLAQKLSKNLNLEGVFCTISNACASAGYALKVVEGLLEEEYDAVLLCGVEAKSITTQATFKSLLVLDPDSCKPFSDNRKGTVLGSGAAALLFRRPLKNAHKIYASVKGMAMNCDAYHATSPEPTGKEVTRSVLEALSRANISPSEVSIFVPHATGTQLNDAIEYKLLTSIFGEKFSLQASLLLKQYIGHTGGASAAFSLLVAALVLNGANATNCPRHALVMCTAFGGNNFSAILSEVSRIGSEVAV